MYSVYISIQLTPSFRISWQRVSNPRRRPQMLEMPLHEIEKAHANGPLAVVNVKRETNLARQAEAKEIYIIKMATEAAPPLKLLASEGTVSGLQTVSSA